MQRQIESTKIPARTALRIMAQRGARQRSRPKWPCGIGAGFWRLVKPAIVAREANVAIFFLSFTLSLPIFWGEFCAVFELAGGVAGVGFLDLGSFEASSHPFFLSFFHRRDYLYFFKILSTYLREEEKRERKQENGER